MSRSRAHRLIDAAEVAQNLLPVGNKPVSERQLRPLASLEPEEQRMVWEQAVEESDGKQADREYHLPSDYRRTSIRFTFRLWSEFTHEKYKIPYSSFAALRLDLPSRML